MSISPTCWTPTSQGAWRGSSTGGDAPGAPPGLVVGPEIFFQNESRKSGGSGRETGHEGRGSEWGEKFGGDFVCDSSIFLFYQ